VFVGTFVCAVTRLACLWFERHTAAFAVSVFNPTVLMAAIKTAKGFLFWL
jgi:hypothetical protein